MIPHRSYPSTFGLILLMALLSACSGRVGTTAAAECSNGLSAAYAELEEAKVKGFGGSLSWSKAASLLTSASVQRQLERYPSCIDKVRRARFYIQDSQR